MTPVRSSSTTPWDYTVDVKGENEYYNIVDDENINVYEAEVPEEEEEYV
jgi:hypothetical protein